jgi:hypothetical protein
MNSPGFSITMNLPGFSITMNSPGFSITMNSPGFSITMFLPETMFLPGLSIIMNSPGCTCFCRILGACRSGFPGRNSSAWPPPGVGSTPGGQRGAQSWDSSRRDQLKNKNNNFCYGHNKHGGSVLCSPSS